MKFPSEITKVKVIYDDRDPSNSGWFARAYNDTYPLPDESLGAEAEREAADEARKIFKWQGKIEVYDSITRGMPSSVIPAE